MGARHWAVLNVSLTTKSKPSLERNTLSSDYAFLSGIGGLCQLVEVFVFVIVRETSLNEKLSRGALYI